MMLPVAILAVLAVVGGFIQTRALGVGPSLVSDFLEKVVPRPSWEGGASEVVVTFVTMILATALFVGALRMRPWSARFPWAQRLLEHKYYFDEAYDRAFVRPMDRAADVGYRDVEERVIDGSLDRTGSRTTWAASYASLLQTGYFRNYTLVFVAGVVIVAVLLIARF